jgi:hypothetical protein
VPVRPEAIPGQVVEALVGRAEEVRQVRAAYP